jgi:hypothetical protein
MATEASAQREKQEQSIKARKSELFVEEKHDQDGPRKKFRDYLRETPATPLSKNVKLMLWGSAAPVVLLFLGALLTSKGSTAKPPSETVLPPTPTRSVAVVRNDEPPPKPAAAPAEEKPKENVAAKPREEKPKPKDKDKKKPKDKDKKKPAGDASPSGEKVGGPDKPTKDDKNSKGGEKDAMAKKDKDKADPKAKPDSKDKDTTPSPSLEKKRSRIFKPKKAYNPVYPKREPVKKDDTGDAAKAKPGTAPDAGSNSP